MSAVARDVGRGQERLAAFRVARCQNGDRSVTGPASGIPGRTEQVDLDRLGAGRKIGSTGADSAISCARVAVVRGESALRVCTVSRHPELFFGISGGQGV
jgi:hypothetical protein